MKPTFGLFALLLITSCALGQVTSSVGPTVAPLGCPIAISIANDTSASIFLGDPCPFQVRNSVGSLIYIPICIQIIVTVNPGEVFTTSWGQWDDFGFQVGAGTFFVDVLLPAGTATTTITISATEDAGLAQLGVNRIGTTRNLYLCAPPDSGFGYAMAASGPPVSGGIVTCGGVVPLELDALLFLSIGPNPFFLSFTGTLDGLGSTTAPAISVPNLPSIIGAGFFVAAISLDLSASCIVRSISSPLIVVIV